MKTIQLLAVVITAAGSGSVAAALPFGSIGLLAPQLGLAASVPVLAVAAAAVIIVGGGVVLASKASESRKQKGRR